MPINPLTIKIIAALGLLALSAFGGYKYGHDSVMNEWLAEKSAISDATVKALITLNEQRKQKESELSQSEKSAWEQYQHAQTENDRLNYELSNRHWRVRVITKADNCSVQDTESSSVGDGAAEQYAELPEQTSRSIAAIGRDADQCEAKLKALQDYVKIVVDTDK